MLHCARVWAASLPSAQTTGTCAPLAGAVCTTPAAALSRAMSLVSVCWKMNRSLLCRTMLAPCCIHFSCAAPPCVCVAGGAGPSRQHGPLAATGSSIRCAPTFAWRANGRGCGRGGAAQQKAVSLTWYSRALSKALVLLMMCGRTGVGWTESDGRRRWQAVREVGTEQCQWLLRRHGGGGEQRRGCHLSLVDAGTNAC